MRGGIRGDQYGMQLSSYEYDLLYYRAVTGTVKEACAILGKNPWSAHHTMRDVFRKLGVEDVVAAFRVMGWLTPIPRNE